MEKIPQKTLTPARINPNNEIKISQDTDVHGAIDFIYDLIKNKGYKTIKICGLNNAIKKVVLIAEIIKSKIPGLYQINNIDCIKGKTMKDKETETETYIENQMVPRMEILLTINEPSEQDKQLSGYQDPQYYNIKDNLNIKEEYNE